MTASPKIERLRSPADAGKAVERGAWNAEPLQGAADRQRRLLDQVDDLELLGGRTPRARSSPSAIMLSFNNRSSSACSATTSFRVRASRRSAFATGFQSSCVYSCVQVDQDALFGVT
jgi:hypothetical protein